MKRASAILLLLGILLLGTAGSAFAGTINQTSFGRNNASFNQTISQGVMVNNKTITISGPAVGGLLGFGFASSNATASSNSINIVNQTAIQSQ
jgi:hypothetical protein